jgi:hypothetical protein
MQHWCDQFCSPLLITLTVRSVRGAVQEIEGKNGRVHGYNGLAILGGLRAADIKPTQKFRCLFLYDHIGSLVNVLRTL